MAGDSLLSLDNQTSHGWSLKDAASFPVDLSVSASSWLLASLQPRDLGPSVYILGLSGGPSSKELTCQNRRLRRPGFHPWFGKIPWRREWQLTPVFLPGESHEQRSLMGYSPWVPIGSGMTEVT